MQHSDVGEDNTFVLTQGTLKTTPENAVREWGCPHRATKTVAVDRN